MRKIILSALAAVALATPALAADKKVAAAAPPEPYNPWDVAFGGGITSDYIFRGITQSNHKPSVARLFRTALQRHQGPAVLCRRCGREHLVPEPRGRRGRHLRRRPPDLRSARARFRRLVLLVSGRAVLQRQRRAGVRLRLSGERLSADQRQRHQKGSELLRGLRQGHLHGERPGPIRRRCLLLAVRAQFRRARDLLVWRGEVHRSEQRHADGMGNVPVRRSGPLVPGLERCLLLHPGRAAACTLPFPNGIPYRSYTTWNVGIGITKSVFTLDFRYYDTDSTRATATPSRATTRPGSPGTSPRSIRLGSARAGAARASS